MKTARISLTFSLSLSLHLSLSATAPGWTSRLRSVSAQNWCMEVLAGWPNRSESTCRSLSENVTYCRPYFSSRTTYVMFVLLGWFMKWEANSRRVVVLWLVEFYGISIIVGYLTLNSFTHWHTNTHTYIYIYIFVCVCVWFINKKFVGKIFKKQELICLPKVE